MAVGGTAVGVGSKGVGVGGTGVAVGGTRVGVGGTGVAVGGVRVAVGSGGVAVAGAIAAVDGGGVSVGTAVEVGDACAVADAVGEGVAVTSVRARFSWERAPSSELPTTESLEAPSDVTGGSPGSAKPATM